MRKESSSTFPSYWSWEAVVFSFLSSFLVFRIDWSRSYFSASCLPHSWRYLRNRIKRSNILHETLEHLRLYRTWSFTALATSQHLKLYNTWDFTAFKALQNPRLYSSWNLTVPRNFTASKALQDLRLYRSWDFKVCRTWNFTLPVHFKRQYSLWSVWDETQCRYPHWSNVELLKFLCRFTHRCEFCANRETDRQTNCYIVLEFFCYNRFVFLPSVWSLGLSYVFPFPILFLSFFSDSDVARLSWTVRWLWSKYNQIINSISF